MPDLEPAVVAVLAASADAVDPGAESVIEAAGIPFSALSWGDRADPPLVLIHGITASARIWWRVGPALAASGRRVVAVDLPGHGRTGHWAGHHRFRDNAADVAAWIRAAGLDVPEVDIVGHSWGAMTAAALPVAGVRPATLVLLDPPAIPYALIAQLASDPSEVSYPDLQTAVREIGRTNPDWPLADVRAKAEAIVELDMEAARAVVLENGDWDGGLADISDPAADGVPIWLVRADPMAGGLLPDAALPAFEARIGKDHVVTMPGAPHAPQRTHAAETTAALLAILAR
ncbi:MAG: alpha/beta fold hydrolase [Chloroflexota bacterium]